MNILIFSDLPTSGFDFPEVQPDLILLLGDISLRNLYRIEKKYLCKKIGILGNHDKSEYYKEVNISNAHKCILNVDGLVIAGFQGSPIYNDKPFGQHSNEEVAEFLATINQPIDIFIAHSNPVYSDTDQDSHRGFAAFNEFIQQHQPKYFLHGHLHEPFEMKVGNTHIHSIYPYGFIQYK